MSIENGTRLWLILNTGILYFLCISDTYIFPFATVGVRGVARLMEKYRHKLFRRGVRGPLKAPCEYRAEAHVLYNIKGDVYGHFGSVFNNRKFRLFCPFLTISLRTN